MKIRFFNLYLSRLLPLLFLFSYSCKDKPEHIAKAREDSLGFPVFRSFDQLKISAPPFASWQKDSIIRTLKNFEHKIWDSSNLSGHLLIAHGDKILVEKYSGIARENPQVMNGPEVPLHVASVTKPLTAIAILKLVEQKKISLEAPVSAYLQGFPYPQIKIKHLLSHRSGLPRYEHFIPKLPPTDPVLAKTFLSNQDILDVLKRTVPPLAKGTDTGFMYCNTNYALLALIIEKIAGKPYPLVMKEMIFKPLGMRHTYILTSAELPTASQSFYQRGHKLYPLDKFDLIYGDKNLFTTAQDLLKFSRAMFQKEFLADNLLQEAFVPRNNEKPGVNNYGYGFRMKIYEADQKLIYHTGWWHGSNTLFIHMPASKTTIISLGNVYTSKMYTPITLAGLFEALPVQADHLRKLLSDPKAKQDHLTAE